MSRAPHFALGLIGRVFAILLLAVLVEYGASTFLYERASQFSVRQDEAHRLAEHLLIASKLIEEQKPADRPDEAAELTTARYAIAWRATLPRPPAVSPSLDKLARQIVDWEPDLAQRDLRVSLTSPGRDGFIAGALKLTDGSWITFRTRQPVAALDLAFSRILLALTPAVALILIGGLLLRQTLRPMRDLARAADRVGHGAVAIEPVPERGPGEVRDVVVAFNAMQARIHRLIADRTQALAAVGHDFRTPLARLRLRADAIADDDLRHSIQHDVVEMGQMVTSLLAYLAGEDEADAETPASTDLAVMCATLVDDVRDRGGQATYHGPDHCELTVRYVVLKRALTNLIDNALHYGDRVDVRLDATPETVTIAVEDDGPGIAPDDRARALEPFVRLDPARGRDTQGFGLGLAIVQRAVATHNGRFTLDTAPSGGLSARITLPRR
ncbi:MAG: HAMP domain-containing protein [Sphingomonas sp.]|uniref:ATP-binding protein n=1 Tax=Sphingomonas sp. TaxID=28214 RepID=UPI001ACFC75E|nr:ATP-binding protein [Sphingomonas sp.]MBN8816212.1 HAMP domain-containing protein [Sphingomonas sp.]MBN8850195.1 HAMP domain-containing protein [Sphingomonas sp.]